jgi:1-acyl-sn-glycerol-3-phosphate acyltransferase
MPSRQQATTAVPPISAFALRFFTFIVRRYFRRHFRSVMAQHLERLAMLEGPAIVYANHTSWWDPMLAILLAQTALPARKHYAPMDASALKRYPILRKLGIFPVAMTTARGAAQFLRTGRAILQAGGVLWVTPQGRFADPREPQLAFKPGLAALALRVPGVALLPMAIEYTFWDERLPEALLHFRPAVALHGDETTEEATQLLESELREAMQTLRDAAIARDASAFEAVLQGSKGTGGFYALGRRMRSLFTRTAMQQDHTKRVEP